MANFRDSLLGVFGLGAANTTRSNANDLINSNDEPEVIGYNPIDGSPMYAGQSSGTSVIQGTNPPPKLTPPPRPSIPVESEDETWDEDIVMDEIPMENFEDWVEPWDNPDVTTLGPGSKGNPIKQRLGQGQDFTDFEVEEPGYKKSEHPGLFSYDMAKDRYLSGKKVLNKGYRDRLEQEYPQQGPQTEEATNLAQIASDKGQNLFQAPFLDPLEDPNKQQATPIQSYTSGGAFKSPFSGALNPQQRAMQNLKQSITDEELAKIYEKDKTNWGSGQINPALKGTKYEDMYRQEQRDAEKLGKAEKRFLAGDHVWNKDLREQLKEQYPDMNTKFEQNREDRQGRITSRTQDKKDKRFDNFMDAINDKYQDEFSNQQSIKGQGKKMSDFKDMSRREQQQYLRGLKSDKKEAIKLQRREEKANTKAEKLRIRAERKALKSEQRAERRAEWKAGAPERKENWKKFGKGLGKIAKGLTGAAVMRQAIRKKDPNLLMMMGMFDEPTQGSDMLMKNTFGDRFGSSLGNIAKYHMFKNYGIPMGKYREGE